MLQRVALVAASAALGVGAGLAAGACGEDRGGVEVQDGGTAGTGGTGATAPTTPTSPTAPE